MRARPRGAVLLERYVVEELLGGRVSHCYGHTFSEPVGRFAFQRALSKTAAISTGWWA